MHRAAALKSSGTTAEKRQNGCFEPGLLDLAGPLMGGGLCPDLFRHLDRKSREQVFAHGRLRCFAKGECLFRQGEPHSGIFYIQSGHVRTYYISAEGREITLARWRAGNIVGTPDVFGGGNHMWSGVAIENTQALEFGGEVVRKLTRKYPDFAVGLVENLSFKGRCMSSLVQLLGTRTVNGRLVQILLALCSIYGVRKRDGILINARVTHDDLACMVGASRVWVTTTLQRLEERGVLAKERRAIKVLRIDNLQAISLASSRRRREAAWMTDRSNPRFAAADGAVS